MKVVRRDEKKSKETFDGDDECTDGEIERSASARVAACDVGLFYVTWDMHMHMRIMKALAFYNRYHYAHSATLQV